MKKINALIIGAGIAGKILAKDITKNSKINYKVLGFLDDSNKKQNKKYYSIRVLGKIKDLPKITKKLKIKEVLISIPSAEGETIKRIVDVCEKTKVNFKILPTTYEILKSLKTKEAEFRPLRKVRIEDLLRRKPSLINLKEILNTIRNKTILITGAGGSIGFELTRQIIELNPKKVLLIDNCENNLFYLIEELKREGKNKFLPFLLDIKNKTKLEKIFVKHKPEIIFHTAAYKHVPLLEEFPDEAVINNIIGSRNIIGLANKYNCQKFVLLSTDKAVNPANVMGATKRVIEMLVQSKNKNSKTKFMSVRFGNVLGSKGSLIPLLQKQIEEGGPITITHPKMLRYFMTIPEASQLVIQAASLGKGGEIFVLDMGKPVKILDLAKEVVELSGYNLGSDIKVKYIGIRPGEKLNEELLTKKEKLNMTKNKRIFITKCKPINELKILKNIKHLENLSKENKKEEIKEFILKFVNEKQNN